MLVQLDAVLIVLCFVIPTDSSCRKWLILCHSNPIYMNRVSHIVYEFLHVYLNNKFHCIAITRILPGLEAFLREVLASENLSPEAEKQRLGFVKELEELTRRKAVLPWTP